MHQVLHPASRPCIQHPVLQSASSISPASSIQSCSQHPASSLASSNRQILHHSGPASSIKPCIKEALHPASRHAPCIQHQVLHPASSPASNRPCIQHQDMHPASSIKSCIQHQVLHRIGPASSIKTCTLHPASSPAPSIKSCHPASSSLHNSRKIFSCIQYKAVQHHMHAYVWQAA